MNSHEMSYFSQNIEIKLMSSATNLLSALKVSVKTSVARILAPIPTSQIETALIIQSTLVISNSKGLTETLRDIRTATYQS